MTQIFPILVFILLVVISTVLLRKWTKSNVTTMILAPLISCVLYQIIGYFIQGYWDPFLVIAIVVSYVISFIMSIIVLFLMKAQSK